MIDFQLCPYVLRQPTRDFHPADVLGDWMMSTGLSDKHPVSSPQFFDRKSPFDLGGQVALEASKKNRETGHRHTLRRIGRNVQECLRVSNHKLGWTVQFFKSPAQLAFLYHHANGVTIE